MKRYRGVEKQNTRRAIYDVLATEPFRDHLMMPHNHRAELDVALSNNYPIDRMYFVDKSPGILAAFTKQLTCEEERLTRGRRRAALLSDASSDWCLSGGRVNSAHLDFDVNFCEPMRQQLSSFLLCGFFSSGCLAITFTEAHQKGFSSKQQRFDALVSFVCDKLKRNGRTAQVLACSYYKDTSPMLWIILKIYVEEQNENK